MKDWLYYFDALNVYILLHRGVAYMLENNNITKIDLARIHSGLNPVDKDKYQELTFRLLFGDKK